MGRRESLSTWLDRFGFVLIRFSTTRAGVFLVSLAPIIHSCGETPPSQVGSCGFGSGGGGTDFDLRVLRHVFQIWMHVRDPSFNLYET